MRIDLHTHSTFSDGTDTPTRLVLNAQEANVDVIAVTDHDTFDGLTEASAAGQRVGVHVLCGIELSTSFEGAKVHLLGYGCKTYHRALNQELSTLQASRQQRIPKVLTALAELGMPLSIEDVQAQSAMTKALGRPHVADAMVAKGYVADRMEAFERFLGNGRPAYVSHYTIELDRAIDLVHDAGGAAVLAHAMIAGRGTILTSEQIEQLGVEKNLDGIEVDHPDHDAHTRDLLSELGARLGLIRTGSSDYHGTGKVNHDLGCETTRETAYRRLLEVISARGGRASVL